MKKRLAKLDRSDEHIADQYADIFDGFQKDAGQNAKDAKLTKKYQGWKLSVVYHPEYKCLSIEDFGTKGMNAENWDEFWQGPWNTQKLDTLESGQRGQGRYLFHYFSNDKIILTETVDKNGNYRFGWGYPGEYDDEEKQLNNFFPTAPKLNHQGTKIWVFNIKEELIQGLVDFDRFSSNIVGSFWEIIHNYNATFTLNLAGEEKIVNLPPLPPVSKEKHYKEDSLKGLGKIKNLILRYCDREVPLVFQGISIQRDGMTIKRIPVRAEEAFKKRIYGYCNFDADLEMKLKKCELPNHMDFSSKRAWNHVREYVERRLDSFVLELLPKKERVYTDKKVLDEAVRLSNKLINQFLPELAEGEIAPGGVKPSSHATDIIPYPKKPIRIVSFEPSQRKIDFGDTLVTDCGVINETSERLELLLTFRVIHEESGNIKHNSKYSFVLNKQSRKSVDIPLLDFDKNIDQSGKYIAEATLKGSDGFEVDMKRFFFYVHEDPPIGKAFIKKFTMALGKGLFFERWRNIPINQSREILIIWDNPEFVRIREQAKSKKTEGKEISFYCIKCGMNEAMQKLLERRLSENKLNTDVLKEIRDIHNELDYAAHLSVFNEI